MIHIGGNKNIDVHRAECLLQIKVQDERPDIVWYLKNLDRWKLTEGESENMERYLDYLGLISRGEVTHEGDEAIKTGKVMIPEAGLYEILYTKDIAFGNKIIKIRRKRPLDMIGGATQDFSDYELYDQNFYEDLSRGKHSLGKFWIKFERQTGEKPKIIKNGSSDAELVLRAKRDGSKLLFSFKDRKNHKMNTEVHLPSFDIDNNMKQWFNKWDGDARCIEKSYDEAKESPAMLKNFRTTEKLEGQQVNMPTGVDRGDWSLKVNVPVAPKTDKDLKNWVSHIAREDLENNPRYMLKRDIEVMLKDIIEDTPIPVKFPKYTVSGEKIVEKFKKNDHELFSMVQAAEDLTPKDVRRG